jgi:hypothetical protein
MKLPRQTLTTRLAVLVFVLGVAHGAPELKPDLSELYRNPFNYLSAHHRPIGAGVEYGVPGGTLAPRNATPDYAPAGAPNSRGRLAVVGTFRLSNAVGNQKVLLWVRPEDPFRMIAPTPGTSGANLPTPAPGLRFPAHSPVKLPNDGDGEVGLYPRNGGALDLIDVFFQFRDAKSTATRRTAYALAITDVWDDPAVARGIGATGVRWPSGVLRGAEINAPAPAPIRHALNCTATRHSGRGAPPALHVLSRTMVWPAYSIDTLHADDDNQGDIPYGTVIALRPEDYAMLAARPELTARQRALLDVFRYYGCRIVDGQGQVVDGKAVLQLRTDGELADDVKGEVNAMLQAMLPFLYPIRNPRPHAMETEIWKDDGLPYVGGGGPIDAKSVNDAWDAGHHRKKDK